MGPRSSGKTALLQEYMRQQGADQGQCYINARTQDITTPRRLAQVLMRRGIPSVLLKFQQLGAAAKLAAGLAELLGVFEEMTAGNSKITIDGSKLAGLLQQRYASSDDSPLAAVLSVYEGLISDWAAAAGPQQPAKGSLPVLVIDEANVLMTWSPEHEQERQTLLRFFVSQTKEQNRSHVLLATSDYSFQKFLKAEIGPGFFKMYIIGGFEEEHARKFLDMLLQQRNLPIVSDEGWATVYEVCGGNPAELSQAAEAYMRCTNWERAVALSIKDVWINMQDGPFPPPGSGYTAQEYAIVVKAILDSPYRAVGDEQLKTLLGGQAPLDAMVRANLLALRPYSPWACDIDHRAFADELAIIVTAPTPMQIYLMQLKASVLLAPVIDEKVTPTHNIEQSAGPSRPPSPTSVAVRAVADQLAAVQGKVADVKKQIQQVSDEIIAIRKAKGEGWRDELAYLQQEKQQLVEEKRQLREEVRLLLEKELLLLLLKREE